MLFCTFKRKNMALFEEYKNHQDSSVRERATNWAIAIGLQRVDGLSVSDFLIEVARQEIEGEITMDEHPFVSFFSEDILGIMMNNIMSTNIINIFQELQCFSFIGRMQDGKYNTFPYLSAMLQKVIITRLHISLKFNPNRSLERKCDIKKYFLHVCLFFFCIFAQTKTNTGKVSRRNG